MKSRTPSTPRQDSQSKEPAHQQLARLLARQIVSGQIPAGSRLSQERELVQIHGVSRYAVRRALDELQAQGLIQRTRRRGTLVTGRAVGQTLVQHSRVNPGRDDRSAARSSRAHGALQRKHVCGDPEDGPQTGPAAAHGRDSQLRPCLPRRVPSPKAFRGRRRDRLRDHRRAVHPHVRLGRRSGCGTRLLVALPSR